MKTKILAMTILWVGIIYSVFIALDEILVAQVALLLIALGKFTLHKATNPEKITSRLSLNKIL